MAESYKSTLQIADEFIKGAREAGLDDNAIFAQIDSLYNDPNAYTNVKPHIAKLREEVQFILGAPEQQAQVEQEKPSPWEGVVIPDLNPQAELPMSGSTWQWKEGAEIYSLDDLRARVPDDKAGASDEQVIVEYAKTVGMDPHEIATALGITTGRDRSALGAGWQSGLDQLQGLGLSALAGGADLLGLQGASESLMSEVEDQGYQGYIAGNPDYDRLEDQESFGDYASWAAYQLGKQGPMTAAIVGAQFIPGLGQGATATGLTSLAAATPRILGGLGASGARASTFAAVRAAGGREAFNKSAEALAKQYMVASGLGFGSLYQASAEDGDPDAVAALLGAPVFGAMESVVPGTFTAGMRVPTAGFTGGRVARAAKGAVTGAPAEALTELGQTSMEIAYDGTMTQDERDSALLNAAAAGALLGGAMSGTGAAFSPARQVAPKETENQVVKNELGEVDLAGGPRPETPVTGSATVPTPAGATTASEEVYYQGRRVAVSELEAALERLDLLTSGKQSREQARAARAEKVQIRRRMAEIDQELGNWTTDLDAQRRQRSGQSRKNAQRQARKVLLDEKKELQANLDYLNEVQKQSQVYERAEAEATRIRKVLADARRATTAERQSGPAVAPARSQVAQAVTQAVNEPRDLTAQTGQADTVVQSQQAVRKTQTAQPQPAQTPQPDKAAPTSEPVRVIRADDENLSDSDRSLIEAIDALNEEVGGNVGVDETEAAGIDDVVNKLNAEVESSPQRFSGPVTLPKGVIAGVVTMLRNPRAEVAPIAYAEGADGKLVARPDADLTSEYAEQLINIREAAMAAAEAAAALNNYEANAIPDVGGLRSETGRPVSKEKMKKAVNTESGRMGYRGALAKAKRTMEAFVEAAGGERNAQAIIGAMKTRNEKNLSATVNKKPYKRANVRFRKSVSEINSQRMYEEVLDTNLSSAFARWREDGFESQDYNNMQDTRTNFHTKDGGVIQPLEVELDKDGIIGLINKVASWKGTSSAYANGLGKAIVSALENLQRRANAEVRVEFIADGETPSYDPNEGPAGTIYLHRTASQEQVLHETLHAALQWFVYSNPEASQVTELSKALDDIFDFVDNGGLSGMDDMSQSYVDQVTDVLNTLRALRKEGRELDAVLELVSYGATMNNFRKFLKGISGAPRSEATITWFERVSNAWKALVNAVSHLLGVNGTVANTVLENTVTLLENVTNSTDSITFSGNRLYQTVTNPNYVNGSEQIVDANGKYIAEQMKNAAAREKEDWWIGTKWVFDLLGWEKLVGKVNAEGKLEGGLLTQKIAEFGNYIHDNMPGLTRFIRLFNATFAHPVDAIRAFEKYKQERGADYQVFDDMLSSMESWAPEKVVAIVKYLDEGDPTAMQKFADADKWLEIADMMRESLAKYAQELDPETRSFFGEYVRQADGTTTFELHGFTDIMIDTSNRKSISSHRFGLRSIANQIKASTVSINDSLFEDMSTRLFDKDPAANNTPILDDDFYRVDIDMGGDGSQNYSLFVSTDVYHRNDGDISHLLGTNGLVRPVDTKAMYRFAGMTGNKYRFTSKKSYTDAMNENKRQELIMAMRNTLGGLANYAASKNLVDNLLAADMPMFDTVAELNQYLGLNDPTSENWFKEEHLQYADEITTKRAGGANWKARATGTFVRIPGDPDMEGSQYGKLAGKIIPADLWVALNDTSDRDPVVNSRAYNASLQFWKKTKTVYNPGTQVTNVASNVVLMMFHGIPTKTAIESAKLIYRYANNPEGMSAEERALVRAFQKSGAMIGNFSNTEIHGVYAKAVTDGMSPIKEDTLLTKLSSQFRLQGNLSKEAEASAKRLGLKGKEKLAHIDKFFVDAYNAGDNVFRMAAFLTKAGELMKARGETAPSQRTIDDAGLYAKKAFIDYDIDAPAIKFLRQTFMPFVSYTYGIMPVLARIVATKPWMIANVMVAMHLLDLAFAGLAGDDDDEIRRLGPDGMEDRVFGIGPRMHLRLPFFGDSDNPVYMRIGEYVPFATTIRGDLPNSFLGLDQWPQGLTPSNPLLTSAFAMFGFDAFTGKSIWDPSNTGMQNLAEVGKRMYTNFAPPLASHYNFGKLEDILNEKAGPTGETPSGAMFFFGKILGLKLENYNMDEEAFYQRLRGSQVMRDYKAAISKHRRNELTKGVPDYEAMNEEIMGLYERMYEEYQEELRVKDNEEE